MIRDVFPYLRLSRGLSYVASDLTIIAGVIIDLQLFRYIGDVPAVLLLLALALPFIAAVGVKGVGDILGLLLQDLERSENLTPPVGQSAEAN